MGIPEGEVGGARWSIDHLFLDQDGVPTLVEVKRSSDTRLRREVVRQMLDYAANAAGYWTPERIQSAFEANCDALDATGEPRDPDQVLMETLGIDSGGEDFWQQDKVNLRAGRLRLIFVADIIPPELVRVVEFLNEQMDPAEVLAVEVRQYVGGKEMKTLVPRVLGRTAVVQQRKKADTSAKRNWDEPSFMAALRNNCGPQVVQVARALLRWSRDQGLTIWWGGAGRATRFVLAACNQGRT